MSLPFNPNSNPVPVYFARVPETPQNQPYEPQRVRVMENAAASLIVDNRFRQLGDNPFNFRVKFAQSVQNVRRTAVSYVQFSSFCGNINRKNNTLQVTFTTGPIGTYTFTLTPGYYVDGASVVAMMNPILNAGLAGFAIAYSTVTHTFTFTYNGIDLFFIVPTCSFSVYGIHMWGFPVSTTPTTTKVSEFAQLQFNTQLVIRSGRFTQYEKNNSSGANARTSDHLQSVFYRDTVPPGNLDMVQAIIQFPTWRNYESQTQITDADIELLDEWGDSPITYTDSPTTFLFQMEIITVV